MPQLIKDWVPCLIAKQGKHDSMCIENARRQYDYQGSPENLEKYLIVTRLSVIFVHITR